MNFEDATVVRLADPGTRGTLFDDASDRTELQLRLHGLGLASAHADAVWRGAISAHATPPAGIVSAADTRWGPACQDGGSAQRTVNGTVTLQFTSTGPATPVPVTLPVAALVLVRDVGVSIDLHDPNG